MADLRLQLRRAKRQVDEACEAILNSETDEACAAANSRLKAATRAIPEIERRLKVAEQQSRELAEERRRRNQVLEAELEEDASQLARVVKSTRKFDSDHADAIDSEGGATFRLNGHLGIIIREYLRELALAVPGFEDGGGI